MRTSQMRTSLMRTSLMRTSLMRTSLLALVALVLGLHSASGLQCQTCTDPDCSWEQPEFCSGDSMCSVRTETYRSNGHHSKNITKGCAPAHTCPPGPQVWSANFGPKRLFKKRFCCSDDDCNSKNNYDKREMDGEERECYVCDPWSRKCQMMSCRRGEVCATAKGILMEHGFMTLLGCVSKNLCKNNSMFEEHLGVVSLDPLSCCFKDGCNKPDRDDGWKMEDDDWDGSVFDKSDRVLPLTLVLPVGIFTRILFF